MYVIKQPLFNLDGGASDSSGTDLSGDWGSIAASVMTETPVDEGQPVQDPDTEGLETTEITDAEQVVEPDSETETQEESAETSFNDETEVELGEGRQPVKLSELKQGYLRQSDYTKKTQQLSDERKTFDAERSEWAPAKQTNEFLANNPWLAQQINGFIQEFQNAGQISLEDALADTQYGQYINHLLAENNKLQKENQTIKGDYEGIKLTSELSKLQTDLKADYGDLVTDEYMTTLQERGKAEKLSTATLKEIAEGHMTKQKYEQSKQDTKQVTKEAQAKTIQSLQETKRTLPPQPRATGQRPTNEAQDTAGMSWLDIAKSAGASIK